MKLIYIANIRLPTEKAHGLAVMKMCEALASQGISVELLVPKRLNSLKQDSFEFYPTKRNFKIKRLFCFDLTRFGKSGFLVQWASFAAHALIYCIFKKSDRYYGRDELSLWFLSFFGKHVTWEAHTAKDNWLVRSLLRRVQSVVTISRGLENHFRRVTKAPLRVLVAPSGVDLDIFESIHEPKVALRQRYNLPPDRIVVAYVGKRQTMGEDKGVEKLEEVSRIIEEKYSEVKLVVVSEASPADVPAYMKAADILVMNYPNKEHYAKFMSPLKLFEYMASGNPVITSNLPTIREIVDESTATFFEPDDKESLISAVNYVIKNPEEAKMKALKALGLVKKYSWQERARNIVKFIR
jgi:glycosyltransferase involved in cell wall biosynthesis